MLRILTSIFLVFLTNLCNAQGGWNIGYIQVDSISKAQIGLVVRIDFKSINAWTNSDGQRYIRSYVGTKDTATITIDTTVFILAERRKIYVDHGGYGDQFLECINCGEETLLIYDAKILNVNPTSIQFELDIETKRAGLSVKRELIIARIDRNKLDGLLYKL